MDPSTEMLIIGGFGKVRCSKPRTISHEVHGELKQRTLIIWPKRLRLGLEIIYMAASGWLSVVQHQVKSSLLNWLPIAGCMCFELTVERLLPIGRKVISGAEFQVCGLKWLAERGPEPVKDLFDQ